MNKFTRIIILIIGINAHTFAQTNKISIGIEGAPTYKSIYGNNSFENSLLPAFSGGLFLQYDITNVIKLKTDLLFERKGYSLVKEPDFRIYGNMDYITLPVLFKIQFNNKLRPFINAGPYFGYLINYTSITEDDYYHYTKHNDFTASSGKFNIGVSAGIGLNYLVRKKLFISAELRNNLGFYGNKGEDNSKLVNVNTIGLYFGLGYAF